MIDCNCSVETKHGDNKLPSITHTSFVMTEACNLRCEYCFFEKYPKKTNWKTTKRLIDFLCETNQVKDTLFVQFFGGEPTLMWDLIVDAVEYAKRTKQHNFRFGITSNGLLLDKEKRRFLRINDIDVLFSTDGIKEAQDTHRKLPDGSGSFDKIIDNMKACVEDGIAKVGRLTYTPKTLPYLYDSIVFLQDEVGFPTVAPTAAIDGFTDFTDDDLTEWDKQYAKIIKRFAEKVTAGEDPGMNYLRKCIQQLQKGQKMQAPCGSGRKFAGISPDGGLYPCHRFVQWPEWRFGDVHKGLYHNHEQIRNASAGFELDKASPKCAKCNVLFCGGHCLAANYAANGSLWVPNQNGCKIIPRQFKVAQALYDELGSLEQFKKLFPEQRNGNRPPGKPQLKKGPVEQRLDKIEKLVANIGNVVADIAGGVYSAGASDNRQ